MVAFWGHGLYASILLRPSSTIDPQYLPAFTKTIDEEASLLKRADFETLDTQMRTAVTANEAFSRIINLGEDSIPQIQTSSSQVETFVSNARKLAAILSAEVPEASQSFVGAANSYIHIVKRTRQLDPESVRAKRFASECMSMMHLFRQRIFDRPAKLLLPERLKNPIKIEVEFNGKKIPCAVTSSRVAMPFAWLSLILLAQLRGVSCCIRLINHAIRD
jgi:hypothetical protein